MKLGIDCNALKANIRAIEAQIKALPRPRNDLEEWMNGFAEKDALDTKILDLVFEASDFSLRKNGRMQFNYTMAYVINYHSTGGCLRFSMSLSMSKEWLSTSLRTLLERMTFSTVAFRTRNFPTTRDRKG